jgi:hypothetical protein
MVNYLNIRIDAAFAEEQQVVELCNKKNNLYYVYGMEVSKKSKKEHFHIVLKTERHPDTVTKDIKQMFNLDSDRKYSNKKTDNVVKSIAYACKDGNYFVHWDNNVQIDAALKAIETFQEEVQFKNLRDKIIYHLNKLPNIDTMMNSDLMFSILKIFKEKELSYPSQAWIKQCMVTYYMQNPTHDINMKNIQTLYNIRDPFLEK